jgi:hypothetical protein
LSKIFHIRNISIISANENGFTISTEKTKAMLIYRRKPRVSRKPKIKIRIGTEKIAMVKNHRILGLVIDGDELEQAYPRR